MVHASRPAVCRDFFCGWLVGPNLASEWRPLVCKMVLFFDKSGTRLAVHVDPQHPGAWRREPYYGELKRWSSEAIAAQQQIVVFIRRRAIAVLPDRDVDLGDLDPGDHIRVGLQHTPRGPLYSAVKIAEGDVAPEHVGKWVTSKIAK